jgi:hypothetical protein
MWTNPLVFFQVLGERVELSCPRGAVDFESKKMLFQSLLPYHTKGALC